MDSTRVVNTRLHCLCTCLTRGKRQAAAIHMRGRAGSLPPERVLWRAVPESAQAELLEQMQKGNLSLRLFRKMIGQISSVGSMSSVRASRTFASDISKECNLYIEMSPVLMFVCMSLEHMIARCACSCAWV